MAVVWGLKGLASVLGCSTRTALRVVRAGAPVRVVGRGSGARYFADEDTLRAWVCSGGTSRKRRALRG
jgi:SH3-like domain-containing protein